MVVRYLGITLSTVSAGILLFFTVAGYFFSHMLHTIQDATDARMVSAARHVQEYMNVLTATEEMTDSSVIDSRLELFIAGEGFERIVITDTTPTVLWSSHILIRRGDDFSPYIIEDTVFRAVISQQNAAFSSAKKIGSVFFKALYYPCQINGASCVISIDADQNYFHTAGRLRNMLFLSAGFLMAIWAGMLFLLLFVDRKAKHAFNRAARNERLAFLGHTGAQLAHELKNPLGIMKTSLDAFRKRHDPDKKEQMLSFISEEIMRLSTIIDTILNLSREKNFSKDLFSPGLALNDMMPSYKESFPRVSMSLEIDSTIAVCGDPAAFRQIVDNLISNSVKAMQSEGSISISGIQQQSSFILLFRDTGPGIDPKLAKKLFEPFVSGSNTGTGLGLAIVKSLCDALGWSIECCSREKGSTTFGLGFKEGLWQKS